MPTNHALAIDPWTSPKPVSRPHLRLVARTEGLTRREQDAVAVGRRDALAFGWDASLPRSPVRRAAAALFTRLTGIEGVTPFADERLELLRLFACMMRRDDRRADDIATRLLANGVSPEALHHAITLALA